MANTLAGFPFWMLTFNEDGRPGDAAAIDAFVKEAKEKKLADLFVFSHGWNNDHAMAMALYSAFFGEVRKLVDDASTPKRRAAPIGVVGVIWPSIKWPDAETAGGGAASLDGGTPDLFEELKTVFVSADERAALKTLEGLLDQQKNSEDALGQFQVALNRLTGTVGGSSALDDMESTAFAKKARWNEVLEALAEADENAGGAAGLGDTFGKLWNGAKNALRVATYWKMKNLAGAVGSEGLGPLVGRLHAALPDLRVHLIGHSFGARVVSYTLRGLPASALSPSPVKSLLLLQGAFSHFAFANALPFDKKRKGDLAGMASRVDGPLLATHSLKDTAVGTAYPLASIVAGQDASGLDDPLFKWQAMGHDGAQAVDATEAALGKPGTTYPFAKGKWINLDGNRVIVNGGPPSGSHSDIVHPHTAWLALAAAGIV